MPACTWFGTMARSASWPAAAISAGSTASPPARATNRRLRRSGRGRLPVCVVRMRCVLCCTAAFLLQPAGLEVELALRFGVRAEVARKVVGAHQLRIEEHAELLVLGDELRVLHGGADGGAE